ncbi:hypothetical protein MMC32_005041 [Xylographa parallela]|nr:hypothetical protein [Xylographa parallela]
MDSITWNENHTLNAQYSYANEENEGERLWRFDGVPQAANKQEATTVFPTEDAVNAQVQLFYDAYDDLELPAPVLFPTSMNEENRWTSQSEELYQLNLWDESSGCAPEAPLLSPVYHNAVLESRTAMDHSYPLIGQAFSFVEERQGQGTAELDLDVKQALYMPSKNKPLRDPFLNSVSVECAMMPNESGMYSNINRSMNWFLYTTEALAPVMPSLGEERIQV